MSFSFPYSIQQTDPLIAEPIVTATLRNRENPTVFVNTELFVDTGAFISLAPRSYADLLELDLYSGVSLVLTGVTGNKLRAYAHLVTLEFAPDVQIDLPITFTEKDILPAFLPPLLGNLGVLDQIQTVTFDNTTLQLHLSNITYKDQTLAIKWLQRQALLTKATDFLIFSLLTATFYHLIK